MGYIVGFVIGFWIGCILSRLQLKDYIRQAEFLKKEYEEGVDRIKKMNLENKEVYYQLQRIKESLHLDKQIDV